MKMKRDRVTAVADAIMAMTPAELLELRTILSDIGGDGAGVAAVLPEGPSPREGGAEVPFEEWPDEYWEAQT